VVTVLQHSNGIWVTYLWHYGSLKFVNFIKYLMYMSPIFIKYLMYISPGIIAVLDGFRVLKSRKEWRNDQAHSELAAPVLPFYMPAFGCYLCDPRVFLLSFFSFKGYSCKHRAHLPVGYYCTCRLLLRLL